MIITFTPAGGSAVVLSGAASDKSDLPDGQTWDLSQTMQVDSIVGSAAPCVIDRKNRRYTRSWTVRRAHADYEAACTYELAHVSAIAGKGTATLVQGSASLSLTDAFVTARGRSMGATTEWSYTLEGTV